MTAAVSISSLLLKTATISGPLLHLAAKTGAVKSTPDLSPVELRLADSCQPEEEIPHSLQSKTQTVNLAYRDTHPGSQLASMELRCI
jgi:hypothetical protein